MQIMDNVNSAANYKSRIQKSLIFIYLCLLFLLYQSPVPTLTPSLKLSGIQSSMISSEYAQEAGASFTSLSSPLIRNTRRGECTTTLHEVQNAWLSEPRRVKTHWFVAYDNTLEAFKYIFLPFRKNSVQHLTVTFKRVNAFFF